MWVVSGTLQNSPRPVKFRQRLNNQKKLMAFAHDVSSRVLKTHRERHGHTVNNEYYEVYFGEVFHPTICCKCPKLFQQTSLSDLACHTSKHCISWEQNFNGKFMEHPAYLPGLSLCDYEKLKEPLWGIGNNNSEESHSP